MLDTFCPNCKCALKVALTQGKTSKKRERLVRRAENLEADVRAYMEANKRATVAEIRAAVRARHKDVCDIVRRVHAERRADRIASAQAIAAIAAIVPMRAVVPMWASYESEADLASAIAAYLAQNPHAGITETIHAIRADPAIYHQGRVARLIRDVREAQERNV